MLPAFHGERMRALEPMVGAIAGAEIDSWPLGREFSLHPQMQALTLEVILRVVFGVSEGERLERLRGLLRNLLSETASARAQLRVLLMSRLGGGRACRRGSRSGGGRSTSSSSPRSPSTAGATTSPSATTSSPRWSWRGSRTARG